jgi:hypothetical protein
MGQISRGDFMGVFFARAGVAALLAGLAATAASAAVRYEFTAYSTFPSAFFVFGANPESVTGSFTVEVPSYIGADTTFAPADLVSFSATGSLTGVLTAGSQAFTLSGDFEDSVTFRFVGGPDSFEAGAAYYFADGAFSAPGTYDTVLFGSDQAGRLVVTDLGGNGGGGGGGPVVPEPATWTMLIAGFGLVGGMLRRQRRLAAA